MCVGAFEMKVARMDKYSERLVSIIKKRQLKKGLKQIEIARALGISAHSMSHLMTGQQVWKLRLVMEAAEYLGFSLSDLHVKRESS